jgi:hypothetical protein
MQVAVAIVPRQPGLYAIHADADVWEELGLVLPPDPRPLYAGKANRSLAGRDINTHFASGRTGSSTLRRALAGLLAEPLALRGQPRNPAKPAYFSNFGLEAEGDERLTSWMHHRLRIATWASPPDIELDEVETAVLKTLQPPLNLDKVSTPWRAAVSAGRARLAAQARVWRPDSDHPHSSALKRERPDRKRRRLGSALRRLASARLVPSRAYLPPTAGCLRSCLPVTRRGTQGSASSTVPATSPAPGWRRTSPSRGRRT